MKRPIYMLFGALFLLVACGGDSAELASLPVEPNELVDAAAQNIRNTETFRLEIEQTGTPHFLNIDLGEGVLSAIFRHGVGQYVRPNLVQANIRFIIESLPLDVQIISEGQEQYFRGLFTGNRWLNLTLLEDFDPASLVAQETGFEGALTSLADLEFIGNESLEDGTPVYHLRGHTDAVSISNLVVGLFSFTADVTVDVYIHRETELPARIVVVQPTAADADDDAQPTTWKIDIFGIDEEAEIADPEA